jgi:hypothetical protein
MHDVMDRPQFGGVISRMVALSRSFALFTHLKPKTSGMAQADIRTKRRRVIVTWPTASRGKPRQHLNARHRRDD